jgi:hypothetical protein
MDDYYRKAAKGQANNKSTKRPQQEYELNEMGGDRDSFELILNKQYEPNKAKPAPKQATKQPLLEGYELDEEVKGHVQKVEEQRSKPEAHRQGDWQEVPPNYT